MSERQTKQVIIIRKDLKMRRGKEISQGAHASMGALLSLFKNYYISEEPCEMLTINHKIYGLDRKDTYTMAAQNWLDDSFTKITVTVQTEQELTALEQQAKAVGIPCCLIEDNGKTEFAGVKTKTALAIGPWWSDEIDKITGGLPLY
jgi:peptidyl-tRNA hydrolase, PTH2 family